jgi:hypothetical protein
MKPWVQSLTLQKKKKVRVEVVFGEEEEIVIEMRQKLGLGS